ncbi:gamma carbonic anhydrase family protein [Pinisolibacter aquiterrae]|jgi:carbonic anhydrase/acetyltransferase-like protein (isoleucine patch superfamily)|uniref:gamma carbonic anhydrase family protein n=1 Tax=Pinisolibacter aquiterrae TaxID=2815579 RepID=UPI001C3D9AAD|nr:gamma carbonic anhydrase family protein [Pinisolibacter aquiterrae]MBV5266001.1 gamma carbonic anhydrase family protein [Pinisolibacter aquiterrae]MCC8237142.1 gamma carbonic anhydrase family protein [Pinisolibacter aquiterrae]
MTMWKLDGIAPELPADGSAFVAPTADLIGRVRLGSGASVWFGAVLRGDNEWIEIGDRSNVQDLSVLHTDMGSPLTIGPDCTIGHKVTLHGCTIGANTLVGMGATILNGARIGANSLVGAGALVTENKEFPDNSLIVGVPAKAIRTLDAAAVERLRKSAEGYVRNGARFAASLERM